MYLSLKFLSSYFVFAIAYFLLFLVFCLIEVFCLFGLVLFTFSFSSCLKVTQPISTFLMVIYIQNYLTCKSTLRQGELLCTLIYQLPLLLLSFFMLRSSGIFISNYSFITPTMNRFN